MKAADRSISLEALRAVVAERVRDEGGLGPMVARHGFTRSCWSNIINRPEFRPSPAVVDALGFEEDPPRYRLKRKLRRA